MPASRSELPMNEPAWLIVGFGQVKYMLCLRKEKEGRSLLEGNGNFTVEGKDPFIYAQGRVHIREPGLSRPVDGLAFEPVRQSELDSHGPFNPERKFWINQVRSI
jgi:hypothetical protein